MLSNMNFMTLKQITNFMKKIVHCSCLFVCANFQAQIPIENSISYSFCYICDKICKLKIYYN